MKQITTNRKFARGTIDLEGYDLDFVHRPKKLDTEANALSQLDMTDRALERLINKEGVECTFKCFADCAELATTAASEVIIRSNMLAASATTKRGKQSP